MNSLSKKSIEEDFEISTAMWTNPNVEIYKDFEYNIDNKNKNEKTRDWNISVYYNLMIIDHF